MRDSTVRRVLVVAVLFLLTLPQFAVLGPDAAALWICVRVAVGQVFGSTVAFAIGMALAGLMLIDAFTGQSLGGELDLTLFALTALMVGFAGDVRLNIKLRETQEQLALSAVVAERGVDPAHPQKSREIRVGGVDRESVLDGRGGQLRVRHQICRDGNQFAQIFVGTSNALR